MDNENDSSQSNQSNQSGTDSWTTQMAELCRKYLKEGVKDTKCVPLSTKDGEAVKVLIDALEA